MHRHTVVVETITTVAKGDVFILSKRAHPNISKDAANMIIAEPKGEATNRDALSFRVCIYVCSMYVCIYVCISVTVNSGHFDCVTATDARQRE